MKTSRDRVRIELTRGEGASDGLMFWRISELSPLEAANAKRARRAARKGASAYARANGAARAREVVS